MPDSYDADLSRSIASWLQVAPKRLLAELHDPTAGVQAAQALGDLIVAEITLSYPELCEVATPRFEF